MKTSYQDAVLSDKGVPIPATVTVYLAGTSTKPTIWADPEGAIEKDNPFQADSYGRFQFFADTRLYDIEISGTGITTYKLENVFIPGVYYKTTTGDPPYSYEGMICINTYDNKVWIYAEAQWRELLSWT
jgi:hypothetical protein